MPPPSPEVPGLVLSTGTFAGAESTELFFYHWRPASPRPYVCAVVVHGLGDHSLHSMPLVTFLGEELSMQVFAFDARGHGKSAGVRGALRSWSDLGFDLTTFMDSIVLPCLAPAAKIILVGNSWGGLQVLTHLGNPHPRVWAGIVNAPAVRIRMIPSLVAWVVRAIGFLAPRFTLSDKMAGNLMTKDPVYQEENDSDPLVHGTTSMNLLRELVLAGDAVLGQTPPISLPVMLVQGMKDPIVDARTNVSFFEKLAQVNNAVKLFLVPEGLHECFNEVERPDVYKAMAAFIHSLTEDHDAQARKERSLSSPKARGAKSASVVLEKMRSRSLSSPSLDESQQIASV